MDLMPSAIQSYQKNQNLAGWVQQNEAPKATDSISQPEQKDDDSSLVSISEQHKIYDWLAGVFPISVNDPAIVGRASQQLYEYSIFSLRDISQVNDLLQEQPQNNILTAIEQRLEKTGSYSQREGLLHLKQVFMTLQAAEMRPTG